MLRPRFYVCVISICFLFCFICIVFDFYDEADVVRGVVQNVQHACNAQTARDISHGCWWCHELAAIAEVQLANFDEHRRLCAAHAWLLIAVIVVDLVIGHANSKPQRPR